MARVFLKDIDRGYAKLMKRVLTQRGLVVSVGVQGDKGSEQSSDRTVTNAELASIHEFGTRDGHVPERSFIRSTLDDGAKKYRGLGRRIADKVAMGGVDLMQGLGLLGEVIVSDIKARIERGIPPPLADATIAARENGGTKPLINTGQLKNSITYEVRKATGAAGI